jgi:mRNA-degrading endonuclease RelE of RelBE toxin-antitoxin system
MKIFQSRSFERKVKKLSKSLKSQLDKQVRRILENPAIGTEKRAICGVSTSINSSSKLFSIFWSIELPGKTLN